MCMRVLMFAPRRWCAFPLALSQRGDRKPQHPQADFEELDQSSSSEPEAAAVHGDHDSEREQHAAPAQARGDLEQQRDMEDTPRQRRSFTREKVTLRINLWLVL